MNSTAFVASPTRTRWHNLLQVGFEIFLACGSGSFFFQCSPCAQPLLQTLNPKRTAPLPARIRNPDDRPLHPAPRQLRAECRNKGGARGAFELRAWGFGASGLFVVLGFRFFFGTSWVRAGVVSLTFLAFGLTASFVHAFGSWVRVSELTISVLSIPNPGENLRPNLKGASVSSWASG